MSGLDPRDLVLNETVRAWRDRYPGRWDLLLPVMLIVDAESDWRVLANDGTAPGLKESQRAVLRESSRVLAEQGWPTSWVGHNGISVGPTQASPSEATTLAARPWAGWGTIRECMDTYHIVGVTLEELDLVVGSDRALTDVVELCYEVQRWLVPGYDQAGTVAERDALFWSAPETLNYFHRVTRVKTMMDNYHPRYFTDEGAT
jgi:hypothetical protein